MMQVMQVNELKDFEHSLLVDFVLLTMTAQQKQALYIFSGKHTCTFTMEIMEYRHPPSLCTPGKSIKACHGL